MKIIKKALIIPFLLFPLSLSACKDEIVINNAFIYLVDESCIDQGYIEGSKWQTVYIDNYSSSVTAVAKDGYKFVSWSDGNLNPTRSDLSSKENNNGPIIYYAYFEVNND